MRCLMIFDHLNDIIFTKYDQAFTKHINHIAKSEGLINPAENEKDSEINGNVIVHLFSPIITSQRIMTCQFGNSYTSFECYDGLNLCFDEYMGYLFLSIGKVKVNEIKKRLGICVGMVRYLCGPDVYQLKANQKTSKVLSELMDSFEYLQDNDQAVLVEAVEQLVINSTLNSSVLQILRESVDKLAPQIECTKVHAMILVQNKFLCLYSSQSARELSPTDILFCIILCQTATSNPQRKEGEKTDTPSKDILSYQVLLAGPDPTPKCLPHVIHILPVGEAINIVYILQIGNHAISASLYETFCHLHTMQLVQIQRDLEVMKPAFDNLDLAVKRLNDSLKKVKSSNIETCHKQLMKKWDLIRKKYLEFLKNSTDEALLRAETLALGLLEDLKTMLSLTSVDETVLHSSRKYVVESARIVSEKLNSFNEFFLVKAIKNFSLGSRDSLTINKYLEEFPGLVHFIYIDRNTHRVTTPTLDFNLDHPNLLTKQKIWDMVFFVRNYLQKGTMSLMWKDTTFSYSYFLWFEDSSGTSIKPTVSVSNLTRALPVPGLLSVDFYQKLKETCFPKMAPLKIRCYELFCIHLGLVTSSCVLEHTRRLAATIWELRGHPSHPIDLL